MSTRTKPKTDLLVDETPTPETIKQARMDAGLSQQAAADLVDCSRRFWQYVEAGEKELGPLHWSLFLLATGSHPRYRVTGWPSSSGRA